MVFFFGSMASAQTDDATTREEPIESAPVSELAIEKVEEAMEWTRVRRGEGQGFVLAQYSFLDLLLPGKMGLTAGWVEHVGRTWEFEYLKGSLSVPFLIDDLGEMVDERFSIIGRSYLARNSFHVSYGLGYYRFRVRLGSDMVNRVSGGYYPSMDLIEVDSLGLHLGVGHRWTAKNGFTWGVDWVSWAQPLIKVKSAAPFLDRANNADDLSVVRGAVNVISYSPRLSFLRLQLGYLF